MLMAGEILQQFQTVKRRYELGFKGICEKYGLTQTETDIMMFLHNNPGKDTASDIVELRMLPKANVSKTVESLIQKELLLRVQDIGDRRRLHLMLTNNAQKLIPEMSAVQNAFIARLFIDFTPQEKMLYASMNTRIAKNAGKSIERE